MTAAELIAFLFDGPAPEAAASLADGITMSRRFRAFAEENRTKIRRKWRAAVQQQSAGSVLLELAVARRFVEDRRCEVEYERYGQGGRRAPDLTVTYRANTAFNVEVTQVRALGSGETEATALLTRIVSDKLGQMLPDLPNVLLIGPEEGALPVDAVAAVMKELTRRAEQRDPALFGRLGYTTPAEFIKACGRLSAIAIWRFREAGHGECEGFWLNPMARRPLSTEITRLFMPLGTSTRAQTERPI